MKNTIIDLALKVRSVYEQGSREKFNLFSYSFQFPKNSCEGASRVFAHLVSIHIPNSKVAVVEGYDHPNDDRHYWVLVDDLIYDLTCDQFNGFTSPILGENTNPLSKKYSDLDIIKGDDIFVNWTPGGRYDKSETIGYIEHHLAGT
ncbi:hypothetical protein BCU68_13530 [Vibrio sp. 10N.286.49.B3]|uniref:hypothetical protein n=1 Tax=Vibrio sp. 10N.286.49.B3 TaxID=1880855 RepID=UPI000C818631|nr:hypothetical protein [Vibrio sp. 10N.286.49.B3]PMH42616.1 hypothetical protein BCU68_13530 [Vibrio sp. 10N.286.49.B3]